LQDEAQLPVILINLSDQFPVSIADLALLDSPLLMSRNSGEDGLLLAFLDVL
jgi:hypothetical protein